jgi:chromosome segregation ATPase
MTPSDRGPEIQQRLEQIFHQSLEGYPRSLGHDDRMLLREAAAEIQRLTGELAQARRELREQDLEADRLTRELIQAQGELAQAREERDEAIEAMRDMTNGAHDFADQRDALQASQQGLREALEYLIVKWREYRTTSIAAESKISRLATAQKWSRRAEASTLNVCINDLEAVLTASPVGTAQDPT